MPKIAKELTVKQVDALTAPGLHAVGGVPGLYLNVTDAKTRNWVFKAKDATGKRREVSLGPCTLLKLFEAREKAREMRAAIKRGEPLQSPRELAAAAAKAANPAAKPKARTFDVALEDFIPNRRALWRKGGKSEATWRSNLARYASPIIGNMPVDEITPAHIRDVLRPIWDTKNSTAKDLRNQIELILAAEKVLGNRTGDNPAAWRGNLQMVLPTVKKPVKNHRALPVKDLPAFMVKLRTTRSSISAQALEFTILTGARSGQARGATWGEIDLEARLWTVQGERMKAGETHVVPLSACAVALLQVLGPGKPDEFIFPGGRRGHPLSDMALTKLIRSLGYGKQTTVHGFRSTLRDWAAQENYSAEIANRALSHAVENKAEAAYNRTKLIERRRPMMQAWADYCAGKIPLPQAA